MAEGKRDTAFSGKDGFKGHSFIVEHKTTRVATLTNDKGEERKNYFLNVSVDGRSEKGQAALERGVNNLHASTVFKRVPPEERAQLKAEGKRVPYDNALPYQESQFDKIVEAAGDNVYHDAEAGVTYYGVTGDVTPASNGRGLIINTAGELGKSEFEMSAEAIQGQRDAIVAATELKRELAAAEAGPQDAEVEAEAQTEAEGPEL